MAQLPDLKARIRIDTTQLQTSMAQAEQSTGRAGSMMRTGLGVAAVAVGGALVTMGGLAAKTGIQTAAAMQSAQIGFTTLLGSGEKAKTFLADLSSFAAKTPYELPGLINASRQLIGVGRSAEETIPILTAFGNATSALSIPQEGFQRIMLATTQAMAKGKFQGEEMMQMMENGLPVLGLLARATGKTEAEISKLASQGKLLSADVFPKLYEQMNKEYGGAMEAQSKTLNGAWSTLKDTVQQSLGAAFQPLIPILSTALPKAAEMFQKAVDGISSAVGNVSKVIGGSSLFSLFKDAASGGDQAKKSMEGWTLSTEQLGKAVEKAKDTVVAFGPDAGASIGQVLGAFDDARSSTDRYEKGIKDAKTSAQDLGSSVAFTGQAMQSFSGKADSSTAATRNLADAIAQAKVNIGDMRDLVKKVMDDIKKWVDENQDTWEDWEAKITSTMKSIQGVIASVTAIMKGLWDLNGNLMFQSVKMTFTGILNIIDGTMKAIDGILKFWTALFSGDFEGAGEAFKEIWSGVGQALLGIVQAFGGALILQWGSLFRSLGAALLGFGQQYVEYWTSSWTAILQGMQAFYSAMWGFWSGLFMAIINAIVGFYTSVFGAWRQMWDQMFEKARTVVNGIIGAVGSIGRIAGIVGDAVQGAYNALVSKFSAAVDFVKSIPSKIYNALSSLYGQMYSVGENIVQGLINGVKSLVGRAVDTVKNMADSLYSNTIGRLGIRSPSLKFFYVGEMVGEGFSGGMLSKMRAVADAARQLTSTAMQAATPNASTSTSNTTFAPQITSVNGASASEIVDEIDWRSGFGGSRG